MNSAVDRQRLLSSYALTFFVLGVMVGLLAVLGRVAQEVQHRLILDLAILPRAATETESPPLRPLLDTLDSAGSRFVIAGFLVSLITMSCGGAIWFLGGKPDAPHARTWTILGGVMAGCLLISMLGTAFIAGENLRLIVLVVPSALALVLFAALVYLIVEQTWGLA